MKCRLLGGDVGVAPEVKERADVVNDCLIRRNVNIWAAVRNLEEFVEYQRFMLGIVIVNGKKCAVILLKGRVKWK